MRASDADRDAVAGRLGDALAEGRLSPEEHAERLDALYLSKTYAELEPLTRDLPGEKISLTKGAAARTPEEEPSRRSANIVAIFGGADRKGRWLADPSTTVTCVFGGVELDYRNAVLSQREVTVNITCIFGGVDITVPPGVRVENTTSAIFGGSDDPRNDTVDPEAPLIRITGFVLFGGISFKRKSPKPPKSSFRKRF